MLVHRAAHTVSAIVLCALLLGSCSSAEPAPTPEDTFKPAPVIETQTAKIGVSTVWKEGSFDDIINRINTAITLAGQNVAFDVQTVENTEEIGYSEAFMKKAKAEMAAGTPTVDAYLLSPAFSVKLSDAGLTMDPTEILRQNAPVYFSKCKELFPDKLTGIPTGIFRQPMWSKTALMLREDFLSAGNGICTVEGLFRFIRETIVKPKKNYVVRAYENDLTLQWALENGYYSGYSGFVFFGIDDAGCTPVLIENIQGFTDFIKAMKELRKTGALEYPLNNDGQRECIAFVYDLSYYYYPSPYSNVPIAKGSFTAQLFSPEKPGNFIAPYSNCELALPKATDNDRAVSVARFIEWLYGSQENYDSIIYGEKSVDFVDEAGSYTPLIEGKPLKSNGFDGMEGLFYMWPGATDLSNSDYYRMPSSAPKGVAEFTAEGRRQNIRVPLAQRQDMDKDSEKKYRNISQDVTAIAKQRDTIIYNLIQADPGTFTDGTIKDTLESLRALNNKWLCEQYKGLIQSLITQNAVQ